MTARLCSPDELLEAPTGIDWSTVAESAQFQDPQQALEQGLLIDRASGAIANWCQQPLGLHATQATEQARVAESGTIMGSKAFIDRYGVLHFRCDTLPVQATPISAKWAWERGTISYNTLSVSSITAFGTWPQVQRYQDFSQNWSAASHWPMIYQLTYVSGWFNAVSTGAFVSGSNISIPVDTSVGATTSAVVPGPGNQVLILDGANTETVTVTAVPDATHIQVASVAHNHSNPNLYLTSLPSDIRQAAILVCSHMVRERGAVVLGMGGGGAGSSSGSGAEMATVREAHDLLAPYRKVA